MTLLVPTWSKFSPKCNQNYDTLIGSRGGHDREMGASNYKTLSSHIHMHGVGDQPPTYDCSPFLTINMCRGTVGSDLIWKSIPIVIEIMTLL